MQENNPKINVEQKYQDEIHQLIPVSSLSSAIQEQLIRQSEVIMIPSGSSLFEQVDKSEKLFYLLSGDADLLSNKQFVRTISAGEEVAKVAINHNHSVSAIAITRVVLLMVDRSLLERLTILDSNMDVANSLNAGGFDQLLSSEVFAQISPANLHKVFNRLDDMIVKTGDQVITQNMPGKYFYIVREGRCAVSKHNFDSGETVTLAELEVGGYFGEEALLSDQKRNTTVTMLTAGKMMRLARKDFDDLIQQPPLNILKFHQASSKINQGAMWLDVRFEDEYSQSHLKYSQNAPLSQIESGTVRLAKEQTYILYCDSGLRSSAAAVILGKRGFNASVLDGGLREYSGEISMGETWVDALSAKLREKQDLTTDLPEKQSSGTDIFESMPESLPESMGEQIMAVDQRIRDLKSMFSTENVIAQEWLENESAEPVEDLSLLVEARKKIDHIENMPTNSLYENVSDEGDSELALLRKQLESAQSHIQEERNRVTTDDKDSEQKDLTLRHVSDELETIKNRLKEQESFELTRRESFELQLATERKKMREQLARFSMGLERQQSKSMEIEQIRQAAALESRQIIEKFKEAHKQYNLRQQRTIQTVRSQLQQQATHVIEKARKAQAEKKQALESLHVVQKQLDDLRKQRQSLQSDSEISFSEVPMLVDVESMGDEIDKAKDKFDEADAALSLAKTTSFQNQEKLDQLDKKENSIRLDFIDWFTSSEQFNLDRDNLTDEQKASLERVKKIAHMALEEAFNGQHHRPDDSDDQFFKNY